MSSLLHEWTMRDSPSDPTPCTNHPRRSFFQSVCVLGYCIFPLVLASAVSALISNTIVRGIAVTVALAWSTRGKTKLCGPIHFSGIADSFLFAASVVFMGDTVVSERRMLAVFPVCLFYIVMAWMVYVQ